MNSYYITDAVLSATLKDLVKKDLIIRRSFDQIPPKVVYELSDKGKTVLPILRSICQWAGITYRDDEEFAKVHCQKCDCGRQ